ncbi:MAG: hypothetical protein EZS28_024656 [Streblomastix strix]|uniref:Uncharacterized protein n=1 Tax=Streblomastix strix TaxID=222440 RepID=A0A5J4VB61_9EUKA|nr:MAG: hypothetical protein EZS28_024656 [Streblomastix strix]
MGFFSKIANFGSKILGGVKRAAQWIAPTLHKVLSTVAGPVGMIHPGIGDSLGAGANLAEAVDRLYSKCDGIPQDEQIQNEDYQLFIDSNNALDYAANNQIVDGQASDFALKIAADDIQNLPNSADGDFAFSAESGTVWMYSNEWYNSGDIVLDQVTPASDSVPLVDSAIGAAGIKNGYARGDHQHPLQVSSVLPSADTAEGEAGTANTYSRSDHTHHVNLSNDVPLKDSATGTAGRSNIYASAAHQHLLNVDPSAANVPLVNATAAAVGTSDFYCRNDHVHLQQLTYDADEQTLTFKCKATQGNIQINPTATGYDDGLKIFRTKESTGGSSHILGCSRTSNTGAIAGQWQIFSTPSYYVNNPLGLTISLAADSSDTNRGLCISADGNTLTFNGYVIAGGSVNYSQGKSILKGTNSTGTDGGFYTNVTTVF